MTKNDMARKVRIEVDGVKYPNLIQMGAIDRSQVTVDVPSFAKLRTIITGVDIIPPIDMGFKFTRNSTTKDVLKFWYDSNLPKDIVVIETDGAGEEIDRVTLLQCECSKYARTEYDAAAPTYFRIDITVVPYDILELI